jgi:hypothetical protein
VDRLLLLVAAAFCSTPQDAIVCGMTYELLCFAVQVFAKGKGRKMAAPMMPGGQMVSSLTQLSRKSSMALHHWLIGSCSCSSWQLYGGMKSTTATLFWHSSHDTQVLSISQLCGVAGQVAAARLIIAGCCVAAGAPSSP